MSSDQPRKKRKLEPNNAPLSADDLSDQFHRLSETQWGHSSMIHALSAIEIDTLVGWAHHGDSDSAPPKPSATACLPSESLPPSLLAFIQDVAADKLKDDTSLHHSLDRSALVATGIALEERLTLDLLPIATLFVERCRQLNDAEQCQDCLMSVDEAVSKLWNEGWLKEGDDSPSGSALTDSIVANFTALKEK